jgi:hypothetical protein
MVEYLPIKYETLISNPSNGKKNQIWTQQLFRNHPHEASFVSRQWLPQSDQ